MKEKTKNIIWLVTAIILFLIVIGLGVYIFLHSGMRKPAEPIETEAETTSGAIPVPSLEPQLDIPAERQEPETQPKESAEEQSASEAEPDEPEESPEPYVSPVDWNAAWAVNDDIIAWLYIPGISLSYPVVMDPEDNSFYLTHDAEQNESSAGAIFIEDYNHPDFGDMCTIVYGHRMYDGDMFGTLQSSYSDWESLEQNQYMAVYLPDREIYYQVFAAVPYNNLHILYYYDFDDQLSYRKFINSIYASSELDAVTVSERKPAYGDRLLILSTCLWGDKNSRYLVLARELSE